MSWFNCREKFWSEISLLISSSQIYNHYYKLHQQYYFIHADDIFQFMTIHIKRSTKACRTRYKTSLDNRRIIIIPSLLKMHHRALSTSRKAWLGTPGGRGPGSPPLASRSLLAASEALNRLYFPTISENLWILLEL